MPEQKEMQVQITTQDLILIQLKDLKENIRDLRSEVKEIRGEVRDVRKELNDNINALHNELKSSTGHISIANISTVGIALAVIYAVLK